MEIKSRSRKKLFIVALVLMLCLAIAFVLAFFYLEKQQPNTVNEPAGTESEKPVEQTEARTPDTRYSVIVNKKHPLSPLEYAPTDLTDIGSQRMSNEPVEAIRRMQLDAGPNISLVPASGYRSYETQTSLYNSYVSQYGQKAADTFSARPGYSEHQTGLAMDFSPIDRSFENTAQFNWLQQNAHDYGFILRYPNGKTGITGYIYEPWHWRYVGIEVAKDMKQKNTNALEEYFKVEGGEY